MCASLIQKSYSNALCHNLVMKLSFVTISTNLHAHDLPPWHTLLDQSLDEFSLLYFLNPLGHYDPYLDCVLLPVSALNCVRAAVEWLSTLGHSFFTMPTAFDCSSMLDRRESMQFTKKTIESQRWASYLYKSLLPYATLSRLF